MDNDHYFLYIYYFILECGPRVSISFVFYFVFSFIFIIELLYCMENISPMTLPAVQSWYY